MRLISAGSQVRILSRPREEPGLHTGKGASVDLESKLHRSYGTYRTYRTYASHSLPAEQIFLELVRALPLRSVTVSKRFLVTRRNSAAKPPMPALGRPGSLTSAYRVENVRYCNFELSLKRLWPRKIGLEQKEFQLSQDRQISKPSESACRRLPARGQAEGKKLPKVEEQD